MGAQEDPGNRQQMRLLLDEGRRAVSQGLPNPASQSVLLGVALLLRHSLAGRGPAEAATIAARALDRTIGTIQARTPVACRRGCSHCCHFTVSASAPEILLLARTVRSSGSELSERFDSAVRARAEATRGAALDELMRRCLPCPLLMDRACGSYAGRPMMCRQFLSLSAEVCERNLKGEAVEIPVVKGAVNAGVLCRNLLLAAVRSAGLGDGCYELSSGLAVALAEPDAEGRWRAGAPVFAAALPVPRPQAGEAMIEQFAGLISTAMVERT